MKPIRGLDGPTKGLSDYLAEEPDEADWDGFRSHRGGKSYREIVEALVDRQHGLCGYCEIGITAGSGEIQVEHVVPQSDPEHGAAKALDARNMMACCLGGTRATADDAGQYLAPVRNNTSCGQKKGNDTIPDFVDPRTLPELPSLTRVEPDGRIEVDEDACRVAGQGASGVGETVEFLGLNVERLRRAREEIWRTLEEAWEDIQGDEDIMREAAREELLPDGSGGLSRFFTTRRSYFAAWGGEEVLEEESRNWI